MKLMKAATAVLCLFSNQLSAFEINTLFLTSNESGNGIFTLTNNSPDNLYLKAEVVKIVLEDGKIVKVPLNKDNFMLWDMAVTPSKAILQPGEQTSFAMRYLCQTDCNRDQDNIYQVRFTPVNGPNQETKSQINIRFGLAPYFVIAASKSEVDFDMDLNKENKSIKVVNKGNTFIKINIDSCNELSMDQKGCQAIYYILAGRHKTIQLTEKLYQENMKVIVGDHDQSYNEKIAL